MFPIVLNLTKVKVALIGNGPATERRKKGFIEAGLKDVKVFPDVPDAMELEGVSVVFVGDYDYQKSEEIVNKLHKLGKIVNVEDKTDLCDIHVPAIIRRGDLLITASTGAKSPRLTKRLKEVLEKIFGEEWKERVELIARERKKWKEHGDSIQELSRKTDEIIDREGWIKQM